MPFGKNADDRYNDNTAIKIGAVVKRAAPKGPLVEKWLATMTVETVEICYLYHRANWREEGFVEESKRGRQQRTKKGLSVLKRSLGGRGGEERLDCRQSTLRMATEEKEKEERRRER
ncbi:conserved hypothetical protein [Histoplasma capsulatum H143]|uniref:Uncharacterized protein n=1 Tax=Ajellomyces capsulatus (strain H143) TaxID=544712 RepID=C6HH89_AJECH|nr:conserved hypothetical protein [Histoplasma capsulatum H143]